MEYPDCHCTDCGSLMIEVRRRDGYTYFACENKAGCGREVWAIVLHRPSRPPTQAHSGTELANQEGVGMIRPLKSPYSVSQVRQITKDEVTA